MRSEERGKHAGLLRVLALVAMAACAQQGSLRFARVFPSRRSRSALRGELFKLLC